MAGRAQQTRRGCGGGLLRVTSSGAISQPSLVRRQLGELARDDDAHDLVRALEDRVHAQVSHDALQRVVAQVPVAAQQLPAARVVVGGWWCVCLWVCAWAVVQV